MSGTLKICQKKNVAPKDATGTRLVFCIVREISTRTRSLRHECEVASNLERSTEAGIIWEDWTVITKATMRGWHDMFSVFDDQDLFQEISWISDISLSELGSNGEFHNVQFASMSQPQGWFLLCKVALTWHNCPSLVDWGPWSCAGPRKYLIAFTAFSLAGWKWNRSWWSVMKFCNFQGRHGLVETQNRTGECVGARLNGKSS